MTDLDPRLDRVTAGDQHALAELVVAHLDDIERFIRRRTGTRLLGKESVADLVQSAAREALDNLSGHEFRGQLAFRSWLYQIALTKIIARHRYYHAARRDVRREQDGDQHVSFGEVCAQFGSPSKDAIAHEFEARFAAAFDRLSVDHQRVFFLARVLDLPHAEVALQMDRSEAACRNLLVRAVARLGALLGTETPGSPD
jgi:RNA polymerase sigma factor (sigma-70 family)